MTSALNVRHIAVIGAGMAGRSFALRCVRAGFDVALEDVMPEKLRRAQDAYAELAGRPGEGVLRFANEVEDAVHDADLAVDFVPDELESKLEIFSLLDRMAPPRTILLTPIEHLSLTDLASCTYRPQFCVGVRGELSGSATNLITSAATAPEVLAAVEAMLAKLGMASAVVPDLQEPALTKNL